MKTLSNQRYDCPCCGKQNANQDFILGFQEKDGLIYPIRKCYHNYSIIYGDKGFILSDKIRKKLPNIRKKNVGIKY